MAAKLKRLTEATFWQGEGDRMMPRCLMHFQQKQPSAIGIAHSRNLLKRYKHPTPEASRKKNTATLYETHQNKR
jgi:hypothetical protein